MDGEDKLKVKDKALIEVLNDHYNESCNLVQKQISLRDRLFIAIIVFVGIMLFQIYSPENSGQAISDFVSKQLDLEGVFDISFLGSLIWFSLFGLTLRYYQTVVYIERQQKYIQRLEEQLCLNYNGIAFTREGKSYLDNYPKLSDWAWFLYVIAFPVLLVIMSGYKISTEIWSSSKLNGTLAFNILFFISIVISTALYMIHQHKGK